jgi:hypothetical protein
VRKRVKERGLQRERAMERVKEKGLRREENESEKVVAGWGEEKGE